MAGMFGAPIGISAAEADVRQNALGALQAQKMLGEIQAQPAELELKQAHAKLYGAEAEQKVLANKAQQQMLDLSAKFTEQERAKVVQEKAAEGKIATVNDVPLKGAPAANDPTARLGKFISFLESAGVGEFQLTPLRKELAAISKDSATTEFNLARAGEQRILALQNQAKVMGSMATAALQDPAQYPRLLQQAIAQGMPGADKLPATWTPDTARIMKSVVTQSITSDKMFEQERQTANDKVQNKLRQAQTNSANANVGVAQARKSLLNVQVTNAKKYLGETTEAAIELKKARTEGAKAVTQAKLDKLFPALPLDPKQYVVDQGYLVEGKKVVYVGKNAGGEPLFEWAHDWAGKKALRAPVGADADESDTEE